MSLSPFAPTTSASSEEYEDPIAFIQSDWNVTLSGFGSNYISYSNYQYHDSHLNGQSGDDERFGYDDKGNFYFTFVEDYVNVNEAQTNQRGFHIVKVDPNGSVEWTKSIESSYYNCRYDSNYCNILSLRVLGEDEFYFIASTYQSQSLQFSTNLSLSVSSFSLIIAYHNQSGWEWAESINSPNGYAYSNVMHIDLDESNDIVITLREGTSGGYTEYSIIAYSTAGGKWNRQLEVYYGAPTYLNSPLLMDIEGTTIHYLALTKNNLRYDSQSTYCPSNSNPSFSDYCYAWIKIGSNGIKISDTVIDYPSVKFSNFEVIQSSAYLYGESTDIVDSSYDDVTIFNGTQTTYDQEVRLICSYDANGVLRYNQTFGVAYGNDWPYVEPLYESDGTAFLITFQVDYIPLTRNYDGNFLDNYSQKSWEITLIKVNNSGNYLWHTGIGSNSDDLFDNDVRRVYSSDSGYIAINAFTEGSNSVITHPSGDIEPINGDFYSGLFWFSKNNGTLLDYETGYPVFPLASSPEGGLITETVYTGNKGFKYFMPDNDGDNVGTNDNCPDVYNPSQSDYDLDLDGDACDDDDDNDGIEDLFDYCQRGELNWISDILTDHDNDGCKDSTEEDLDDDNDGRSDLNDLCPFGIVGAGNDFDGDGCKDLEDNDDDNDGVADGSDLCVQGDIDWSSGTVTDHDSDGCNDATEDSDDDNDGVTDLADSCPKGATDWPSNLNTDFDEDGCKDGFEDEDDDNDGVINPSDQCPNSTGTVDQNGCSASQNLDNSGNNDGGGSQTVVYYVCAQGGLVVTDLADCPVIDNNNSDDTQEPVTQFYYVCPGGSEIVTDMAECPEGLPSTSQNITYVIDPDSNYSDDFTVCPGGSILVKNAKDCPSLENSGSSNNGEQNAAQESGSSDTIILVFAGGAFLMAMAAVLLVLLRKPVSPDTNFAKLESADELFTQSSDSLPSMKKRPPSDVIGSSKDGYEWVEWPPGTNTHWYRTESTNDEWTEYGN